MAGGTEATGDAGGGVLSALRGVPPWAWIVLAVAGVALVVAAVWLLRKRRQQSPAGAVGKAPPSLSTLWDRFLAELPIEARFYPVAIVFGASRAGKTHLIQSRVDWEGQDRQSFPSATSDARAQFYVGRRVLVQEIGPALLQERGDAAERALEDLWRPLAGRAPTVMLVVDAAHLGSPDDLAELADYVRGKLNLLAKVCGAPADVRLVLSHMDELEGYRPIAAALGEGRARLRLELQGPADEAQIQRALAPLEPQITRVLLERPAPDFRRAVRLFSREVPRLSQAAAPLLRALAAPGYLTRAPALSGLYLTGLEQGDHTCDPFVADARGTSAAIERYTRQHLLGAAAVVAVVAVATLALYLHHDGEVDDARAKVARFEEAQLRPGPITDDLPERERDAAAAVREMLDTQWFPLLGSAYGYDKAEIREHFLATVRAAYLVPALKAASDRDSVVRAGALARASVKNELGRMVLKDPSKWAKALHLPEDPVRDHVDLSEATYTGALPYPDPSRIAPAPSDQPGEPGARDLSRLDGWRAYLEEVHGIIVQGSTRSLHDLQKDTAAGLAALDRSARADETRRIGEVLILEHEGDAAAIRPLLAGGDADAWMDANRQPLTGLLSMIRDSSLGGASLAATNLSGLLAVLQQAPAITIPPATYSFEIQQRTFRFDSKDWASVIAQSQGAILIDAFKQSRSASGGWAFFADPGAYLDVGGPAVGGNGPSSSLRGIFTRAAFEREVSPPLVKLGDPATRLPLSADDRKLLDDYVGREVKRYAGAYREAFEAYYKSFQLQAGSPGAVRAILSEIGMPASFLSSFLRTVADNAGLPLKDGVHFNDIRKELQGFQPVVTLMGDAPGPSPNLQKYAAMLAPLAAAPSGVTGARGAPLAERLTPLGQGALTILRQDKGSVWLEVEPWIAASGLAGDLRRPFTLPVEVAYAVGMDEVGDSIASAWQEEILPGIRPILTRFPFNEKATEDAAPADVTAAFVPGKGSFWTAFDAVLGPVVVKKGNAYQPLAGPFGSARIPKGALSTANAVDATGRSLWDKEGKERPLALEVKPLPLPKAGSGALIPTLAVLRAGGSSVVGFNQKPSWEPFSVAWAEESPSSVELTLGTPGASEKRTRTIDAGDGPWSFHRLLTRASVDRDGVATWKVPLGGEDPPAPVQFAIRGDPWAPFRVACP